MEVGRQEAVHGQVVKGGQELTGSQVAGGAEDDHAGGLGATVLAQAREERMTVGVGHRSLEAAPSEEDFATVLKEADGAFLANQNFHDVEARMTRTPDLTQPAGRGPTQSPLFPPIHRPIPFPADFRRPCLNFDEHEHLALEHNEIEFVAAVSPVRREASATLAEIVRLGQTLALGAEVGRRRTSLPPSLEGRPQFEEKHGRWDLKGGFYATP